MKIFFDTEFMEDGEVILPLSFGFVADSGERLYVVVSDADWSKANAWVQENVLPNLLWEPGGWTFEKWTDLLPDWNSERDIAVSIPRDQCGDFIKQWIIRVCPVNPQGHPTIPDPPPTPEFWADYGSYDWILLCQLFGTMLDKPDGWPMFVRDIQQKRYEIEYPDSLPEVEGSAHCALHDAINVQQRYDTLEGWWTKDTPSIGRALSVVPIAMTNGPCEGPHSIGDEDVPHAVSLVSFRREVYCGGKHCDPFTEAIAYLKLCEECIEHAAAPDARLTITMSTTDRARLTFP